MPLIHDVSTDADEPPPFVALRELRLKCRNGVEYSGLPGAEQPRHYRDIVPIVYAQAPTRIFQAALAAVNTLQWEIAAAIESEGRIEATATTRWLRFRDDVVIRVRAHNSGTRLDIRSASRAGSSDFGANARRIRLFRHELDNYLSTGA